MKHIAYLRGVIWGVGDSAQGAIEDAVLCIEEYRHTHRMKPIEKDSLKTSPANRLLVTAIEELGGGNLRWNIRYGLATLDCQKGRRKV